MGVLGITAAVTISAMIKNKKKEINELSLNIERLTHGVSDARDAVEHYSNTVSNMNSIIDQVQIGFKGQAADSFTQKLIEYRDFCSKRVEQMNMLIDDYNTRIIKYDTAKRRGEQALQNLYTALAVSAAEGVMGVI